MSNEFPPFTFILFFLDLTHDIGWNGGKPTGRGNLPNRASYPGR